MGLLTLSPRIYFDTNVFIALYEGDRSHVSPGLQLLERGQNRSQPAFATSELTLAELLVRPLASGDQTLAALYEATIVPSDWLVLSSVNRQVLRRAAGLRAARPKLKLPDAIHVATAIEVDCTHLLSADADMADLLASSIPVLAGTALRAVRPDPGSLAALLSLL